MKPFQRSPCSVCGRFLIEHHGNAKDVRCGEHLDWKRPDFPPPAPPPPPMRDGRGREVPLRSYVSDPLVKLVPPPTVEYHQVGHFKYSAVLLLYTLLVLSAGFLMGLALRGGV